MCPHGDLATLPTSSQEWGKPPKGPSALSQCSLDDALRSSSTFTHSFCTCWERSQVLLDPSGE